MPAPSSETLVRRLFHGGRSEEHGVHAGAGRQLPALVAISTVAACGAALSVLLLGAAARAGAAEAQHPSAAANATGKAATATTGKATPATPGTAAAATTGEATPGTPSAADAAQALSLYESTCVSCHGPGGRGDGVAASGLPAKPASFSDPAWQRKISDDEIAKAIVGGGAAVKKSPLMPPNPDLANKPGVVAALRALIRSFGNPPAAPPR